jgi:Skp family chaperone for outer membrane proteins
MSRILISAAAALAAGLSLPLALGASAALAQGAPAAQSAPAASQTLGGPAVPGVCILWREAIFANAKVGVAMNQRLQQLADQANAEINGERTTIEADRKVLEADQDKLKQAAQAKTKPADLQKSQDELQQRIQAWQVRYAAMQQKLQLRQREIEATRQKQMARIASETQPLIAPVYKAHNCGLLIDHDSVLGGNMSGDLTPDVIKALDAKITTITFDRESLAQAAAPAAAK